MKPTSIPRAALLSAFVAAGCASAQVAQLSDKQTSSVVSEIEGRVSRERREAAKAAEEKPAPPKEAPSPVPAVIALKDALKIAGRKNRDLIRSREGLTLSALALLDARDDVGPRLAGSVASILTGDNRGARMRTNSGTLSATSLLPTGATASVTGALSRSAGTAAVDPTAPVAATDLTAAGGSVTAKISQPLLRGAGYEASHEALTEAERQALYDVRAFELSREDLALQVQSAFYGLVSQKQVIRNREASLESFEFLKRRSDRLFELGRVSEVDKFRAAREFLVAQNDLVDARQEYEARSDRFKVLLGIDETTKFDVAEEIPPPSPLDLDQRRAIDVALVERLDAMTARDAVADAERRLRNREQGMLPDLAVEAVGTRSAPLGSRRVGSPLEYQTYSLGVSLELPLDRVHERGALRAARIDLDRARRDLSLKEDSIILEVRDAMRNFRSSESSLKIQIEIAASEEKNVRVARMRFENGEISNRDLTDALTALADARDRLVRERANLETARTQLFRDIGALRLDEDGVWAP